MEKRVIPSEELLVPGKVFFAFGVLCLLCAVLCVDYHGGVAI